MELQRVTFTAWPSSLMAPQESEGIQRWAASPGERVRAFVLPVF